MGQFECLFCIESFSWVLDIREDEEGGSSRTDMSTVRRTDITTVRRTDMSNVRRMAPDIKRR